MAQILTKLIHQSCISTWFLYADLGIKIHRTSEGYWLTHQPKGEIYKLAEVISVRSPSSYIDYLYYYIQFSFTSKYLYVGFSYPFICILATCLSSGVAA